jgi:hypothetical protein
MPKIEDRGWSVVDPRSSILNTVPGPTLADRTPERTNDGRTTMSLLHKAGKMLLIGGAALAGNWVGDSLRALTGGEPAHRLSLTHTTTDGHLAIGLNVALTNFVPALVLGLLAGRPRMLYAFVSGAIISALVGDSYERALVGWLRGHEGTYANGRLH